MIALLFVAALQTAPTVAPDQAQADATANAVVSYFTAISAKAGVLGSCAAFVEPDALETFTASVLDRPGIVDLRTMFEPAFRQIIDERYRAGSADLFDPAPTAETCAAHIRRTEADIERLHPGFMSAIAAVETD